MKNLTYKILFFLLIFSITGKTQDLIRDFDGIPIITAFDLFWTEDFPEAVDSMRNSGVDVVWSSIDNVNQMIDLINWESQDSGFKVIPIKSLGHNWIMYYCDAKYTEWEAEGTGGDTSYFVYNENVMEEVYQGDNGFLKLKPNAALGEKELMGGPFYAQHVYELDLNNNLVPVQYTATFRMKLENNPFYQDTTISDNPLSELCKIQVTQSKLKTLNDWTFECTHIIEEHTISLGEFSQLNQFLNFSIENYTLESEECQSTLPPPSSPNPPYNLRNHPIMEGYDFLKQREYIEFKVIWLGNPNYLLSIDKVTVSDQKGMELMDEDPLVITNINNQLQSLSSYDNHIAGWYGLDEPNSIDLYAPMKKVIEIVSQQGSVLRPVRFPLMGKWSGLYNHPNDPHGTYHLSPWVEMKKRIGEINIWQDIYYLDYPWSESSCINCTEPWYSENIKVAF